MESDGPRRRKVVRRPVEDRPERSHTSDRLNRALIRTWHDLCVWLGDRYSVSESAISHLFVARLLAKRYVTQGDLCPEDYYLDGADGWRRIDLLIGTDLLFETGKPRAIRGRSLSAAVEFKVESEAVTITLAQIESDAVKLQELANAEQHRLKNFNVLVLFRSKQDQNGNVEAWRRISSRFTSVRLVVAFSEADRVKVLHFHRGKVWDISKGGGHFYGGWKLK